MGGSPNHAAKHGDPAEKHAAKHGDPAEKHAARECGQPTDRNAVEAPVLTVNSNHFSSDSCTVSITCRSHELMINSSYQNNRCSPEEVTSYENYTLILDCREDSIICNHSNPVSWKQDKINIEQFCEENDRRPIITSCGPYLLVPGLFVIVFVVVGVLVIVCAALILYRCCKNKTDGKQADDTGYGDVYVTFISVPADIRL
ncbi:hypothetical protein G5714_002323 [Onychostoma macrolepis]|uniref:Uncharacterized protein n=1 Tax=Onychostoma macrolepis TaxID=369639 RepID=A0A7J6DEU3_9TELE|nr:hypothetical protein G5714_002323 [Onychostoma macrolepis]